MAIRHLAAGAQGVLSQHPSVIAAYLYGSAARGEAAADLDIAVLSGAAALSARELEDIAEKLQAEGAPHGPHLDVRPLTGTSPRFRANVLRDGRLLYEADREARTSPCCGSSVASRLASEQ